MGARGSRCAAPLLYFSAVCADLRHEEPYPRWQAELDRRAAKPQDWQRCSRPDVLAMAALAERHRVLDINRSAVGFWLVTAQAGPSP